MLATRGFMAWFGPEGVATIAFSLIARSEHVRGANTIFELAALTVVVSVAAHGLTDHAGSEWMGARAQRAAGRVDGAGGPSVEPTAEPAGDQA
jgi:sodium/hydrogen antiporter